MSAHRITEGERVSGAHGVSRGRVEIRGRLVRKKEYSKILSKVCNAYEGITCILTEFHYAQATRGHPGTPSFSPLVRRRSHSKGIKYGVDRLLAFGDNVT
jgi:hypothetical protein